MKKVITANVCDFCKIKHFAALKRGGSIIRGGAIFGGNRVHYVCTFQFIQLHLPQQLPQCAPIQELHRTT